MRVNFYIDFLKYFRKWFVSSSEGLLNKIPNDFALKRRKDLTLI